MDVEYKTCIARRTGSIHASLGLIERAGQWSKVVDEELHDSKILV